MRLCFSTQSIQSLIRNIMTIHNLCGFVSVSLCEGGHFCWSGVFPKRYIWKHKRTKVYGAFIVLENTPHSFISSAFPPLTKKKRFIFIYR